MNLGYFTRRGKTRRVQVGFQRENRHGWQCQRLQGEDSCKGVYSTSWDDETFFQVAKADPFRNLLAIVAYYDYEIWQMDVKTVFLNGRLPEDLYMTQPEGFVCPEAPDKVCKLQRSIY